MKPNLHLVLAAVALVAVCLLALSRRSSPEVQAAAAASASDPAPLPVMARADLEKDASLHLQQTEARVAHLATQEVARDRYARAAEHAEETRRFLNRSRTEAWATVIRTNRERYLALRAKAAHSPNDETPCTICDGKSYLAHCIMCTTGRGKCEACHGSGHTAADEICPACLGNGKCFTCSGHGRMLCPYCDDGMVRADGQMPNFNLAE